MLSLRHHAASPSERCSSRWWTRHTGTMNSSLTRRPSARGCVKREVIRIGWDAAAHKAGLPKHEPAVLLITQRALVSVGLVFPVIRGPCLKNAQDNNIPLRLNGTRSSDIRGRGAPIRAVSGTHLVEE
jgi:hypothetical protein